MNKSIGLFTPMFLIFLTLKLTNFITWSWWWVTAPLWIPAIVGCLFLCFVFVLAMIAAVK